ncbi:hypothetical protein E8E11_003887 [Didymella keratinophila]|nr:hypothetical protein E8E11_003887 [Didymella keratinophila]
MPSTLILLVMAFIAEQLYALNYQFSYPPSGLVHPRSLQVLKILSAAAAFLAWKPAATSCGSVPRLTTVVASSFFLASLGLFAWTATVALPKSLSVIYGRVTLSYVLSTGLSALVRHPMHDAYTLGWIGARVRTIAIASVEKVPKSARLVSLLRTALLACSVLAILRLYREGAVLEEEQFSRDHETVQGEKVEEDVRIESLAYVCRVPCRWIPGIV